MIFTFAPQYDFKYGLYGVVVNWTQQIAVDFKRHEIKNSNFLSPNGARFIATQKSTMSFPVKQNQYDAYICVLARVISGNFNGSSIKLNVDASGNPYITVAVYDYGNGWKMFAVRNAILDPEKVTSLEIEFYPGDQVEIEHIGAYKNGVPIYPNFKDVVPRVNDYNFYYNASSTTDSALASGGQFAAGDYLAPFVPVVAGVVNESRPVAYRYVSVEGTNRQNLQDGNHTEYYGSALITFINPNTFDSAVTASGNGRNFAESIGVGQYIGITQGGITTDDAKVIGRVFDASTNKYTTKIVLK